MAKEFPKFEDWTPPWGSDDSAFDPEKAKKRVYDLLKDKHTQSERIATLTSEKEAAEARVREFEEKDLSEVEKLRRENERLKSDPPKAGAPKKEQGSDDDDLRADRAEIALEKGLTLAQARRLVGTTREELEADAEAYIEEHGLAGASGDGKEKDGGKEGQAPPSNRAKVTPGTRQRQEVPDPDEDMDPGKLWDKVKGID